MSSPGSVTLLGVGKELLEEQHHQVPDRVVKLENVVLVTLPEDGVIIELATAGVIVASPAVAVIVEMSPATGVNVELATDGVIVVDPPC